MASTSHPEAGSAPESAHLNPAARNLLDSLPSGVRVAVDTLLTAPFPMFVLLGEELRLLYNAAYVPILGGRHPAAAGQPFFDVWPEVREAVGPIIARALAGEALLFEDLPVILHRPDPETAWFTFSYSPLKDGSGGIAGALCVCTETTAGVTAQRRQAFLLALEAEIRELADPGAIVEAAQAALGGYLGVARVGYGSVDEGERFFTTRNNWTDGTVGHFNGTHDLAAFGEDILAGLRSGTPLAISDVTDSPLASSEQALAAFEALQTRAAATVSLIKHGRFVAAMYLHQPTPRRWTPDELALIREVADRTWSAVERVHAEAGLRAVADRQGFLLALGDRLRDVADAEEIKGIAAEMLGRHLKVGRVGYGEIDSAQAEVSVERDWSDGSMASLAGETRPLDVFGPAIIDELRAGRTLRLNSVAADPVSAAYAAGYESIGTKALLIVPLVKEGRFRAILYLHEGEPRVWSDDETAIAQEVAERTWAAVERARAEAAVRAMNATLEQRITEALAERKLFADMVEATDAPIQMLDCEFRFVAINPAARDHYRELFGVSPNPGDSLLSLLAHDPEQLAASRAVWSRALAGESFDELAWWGSDPEVRRAYEMRFRPLRAADGAITGAYLIGRDVTDLRREQQRLAAAEEQLRQAQKMEAMGQLTGGVAHDFNNLLTPIVGSLDLLQRRQVGGEREQRLIAGAVQSAERARVLVQRLLAFARRQPLQPVPVDIGELVAGMAELIASTAGPQIKLAVEIADNLALSRADPNQLEMALLNLAVNARDAMPSGGTLRISAQPAAVSEERVHGLAPGDYIRLSVADTGAGMDEATLKRAVEPFFSTKGIGKGTGLGLSMVHGLASQLGGALAIFSKPGLGTNVELWLPVSEGENAPGARATGDAPAVNGSGIALVVDDEDLVRMSTAEMLSELGYGVIEAGSAEDALAQLDGGLRPAVLVTDHLMPGMTGTELAREVLDRLPQLRVLIVSGYADVDGIAPDLQRLTKPFRKDELAAALAR